MDLTQTFRWNLWESGKFVAISTSIFPLSPKFLDFMRPFCFNLLNFLSKQKVMIAITLKFKARKLLIEYLPFSAHRKIEDEDVGVVPHGLVEVDDQHHQEVPDAPDDYDEGEKNGYDVRDWR